MYGIVGAEGAAATAAVEIENFVPGAPSDATLVSPTKTYFPCSLEVSWYVELVAPEICTQL